MPPPRGRWSPEATPPDRAPIPKQVNHPTVGRVPSGGTIERDSSLDLHKLPRLALLLNDADFATAERVAAAINHELNAQAATVIDSRRVEIQPADGPEPGRQSGAGV